MLYKVNGSQIGKISQMSRINEEGMSTEEFFLYRKKQRPSRHARSICFRFMSHGETMSVLEVGCGVGLTLRQIIGLTKERVRVTGCDIDPEMLRLAAEVNRQEMGGRVSLVCNGDNSLPFATDAFDLVFSEGSLHHFDDARSMISEMWRVLKPGGNFVIIDANPESLLAMGYAAYVETKELIGLARKSETALARSIRHALPEKKVTSLMADLRINCLTTKSRGSICYETVKPWRPS
jgi:ubiquinone/menaquinone biosynthesis C-methylase UbiE